MSSFSLGVLGKGAGFKHETDVLNSKMVAISVLASLPMMFMLNFFANSIRSLVLNIFSQPQKNNASRIAVKIKEGEDGKEIECSVCLCEISEGETYRVLEKCNHGFHVRCINAWLQTNPTCPLCRSQVEENCSQQQRCLNVFLYFLFSFVGGFCKWFLCLSAEPIEDGHYFF